MHQERTNPQQWQQNRKDRHFLMMTDGRLIKKNCNFTKPKARNLKCFQECEKHLRQIGVTENKSMTETNSDRWSRTTKVSKWDKNIENVGGWFCQKTERRHWFIGFKTYSPGIISVEAQCVMEAQFDSLKSNEHHTARENVDDNKYRGIKRMSADKLEREYTRYLRTIYLILLDILISSIIDILNILDILKKRYLRRDSRQYRLFLIVIS